jgi:ATP-binding cassette subfamily C (CFTR/MRP) protein 1
MPVPLLAMGPVTARFGKAQKLWSEKVQRRVAVTSSMLGDMKAVKMLGLSTVLEEVITKLRVTELLTSHMFRRLSVWKIRHL